MIKMTLEQFKNFLSNTNFTVEHSVNSFGFEIYRRRNDLLITYDGYVETKYTAGAIDIYYKESFSYVVERPESLSIDNNRWKFSGLTLVNDDGYPLEPNEYDFDEIIEQNLAIERPDYSSFDLPGLVGVPKR